MKEFVAAIQRRTLFETSVISFHGSTEYPLLFFSQLFSYWRRTWPELRLQKIDVTMHSSEELVRMFATTFLGSRCYYWLGDISALKDSDFRQLSHYIACYAGPHTLLYYVPSDRRIETQLPSFLIPATIKIDQLPIVMPIITQFTHLKPTDLVRVKAIVDTIPLEHAALFIAHYMLQGAAHADTTHHSMQHLVQTQQSLFVLSQYFFAHKASLFFKSWQVQKDLYALPFWVLFWSEQLWRATLYVHYKHKGNNLMAQKMSHRLPYSFINNDWRNYTSIFLQKAHHQIVDCDYQLKNGADDGILDLFYAHFFSCGSLR